MWDLKTRDEFPHHVEFILYFKVILAFQFARWSVLCTMLVFLESFISVCLNLFHCNWTPKVQVQFVNRNISSTELLWVVCQSQ